MDGPVEPGWTDSDAHLSMFGSMTLSKWLYHRLEYMDLRAVVFE
jgi:hypothetical protein